MGEIESGHKGKKVAKPRKGGLTPLEKGIPQQEIQQEIWKRIYISMLLVYESICWLLC